MALTDEFPWVDALPEQDREQFVTDFVRAFQASAEMGQWTPLARTVREWGRPLPLSTPILIWLSSSPAR